MTSQCGDPPATPNRFCNSSCGGNQSATDVIVSIRISVGAEEHVRISATGNPIPMLLTGVSAAPVTIHVPMVASPAYSAVILEPFGADDGFVFWSADFRLL